MKTIHLIAAARPNFMKVAPLYHDFKKTDWARPLIVHTGQHYDANMSAAFFKDLMLPEPHHHLGVGSGSHAEQTGQVMIAYEKLLLAERPDLAVVVGDVNSTVACTLAAVKLGVLTAHLEAGLRSFDRTMPEEINRLVTDAIADILWTPSVDADANLAREGVSPAKIVRVGNIMIDSLEMMRPRIMEENSVQKYKLSGGGYGVVTLHRPSNVDTPETLAEICEALRRIAQNLPIVFPLHPRTRKNLETFGLYEALASAPGMHLDEPVSYLPFMNLVFNCKLAITDSGGLQEETSYLGIPCLTLRPNTERPITLTAGTNRLCAPKDLLATAAAALTRTPKPDPPPLWDGKTAGRVVESAGNLLGCPLMPPIEDEPNL